MSLCSLAWNNSALAGRIFTKIVTEYFAKIFRENLSFIQNLKRIRDIFVYIRDDISLNSCKNEKRFKKCFMFSDWKVEKYGRARKATDGDTAHAYCTLDN